MKNNIENKINYLGVRVNAEVNLENVERHLQELIKAGKNCKIYTINPEFIVDAHFDKDFRDELNSSDINIIDGVGLLYGIKTHFKSSIKGIKNLQTFTGVDLTYRLLEFANKNNLSLFILGGSSKDKVSDLVVKKIKNKYPNILIVGNSSDFSFNKVDDEKTLSFIHKCMEEKDVNKIDILLVAYGHKKQEFWIGRNSSKIPALISVGVGGTLDYISGKIIRAPKFLRSLGLEWLYRLITQPQRFFRIIKATLIFSYLSSYLFFKKNQK